MTKKILMVLAPQNFRDLEYIVPKAFFEQHNCEVETTSTELFSKGRFGYQVYHDFTIDETGLDGFDALFFVGGVGALDFLENNKAKELALKFFAADKVLGAICAAPRVFLKWGILKEKKATGHNWDGNFQNLCKEGGAIFENKSVVTDGNVLTADGPESAEEAALEFLKLVL